MNQPDNLQLNPKATALIANITQLMDEAEQMLCDSTSQHAEEQIELLRAHYDTLQSRIVGLFADAGRKVAAGARRTDEAIRAHPYQSLAIAAGAGALLGVILVHRDL